MNALQLKQVAETGTDREVASAYLSVFGVNITGCIPCQKKDARIELIIMAKKLAKQEQTPEVVQSGCKYTVKPQYLNSRVQNYGPVMPMTDAKAEALIKGKHGYLFEALPEFVKPVEITTVITETPTEPIEG
jgi:hypothetical protein